MANSADLVQVISKCIENCETNKISSLFQDPQNAAVITNNCWDILHTLCAKLNRETYENQPSLFQCCEKFVNKVAECSCPEEALLELLEQAECPDDDHRFLALLKPIQNLLFRMPDKRQRSLVWCLNLVASHLSALPEPESFKFVGEECVLLDSNPLICRAVDLYTSVVYFYTPFIEEVSLFKPQESADKPVVALRQYQRFVLAAFLIHMLGKPLVFIDLQYDFKTKSKARCIAENIVELLPHVVSDVVPILVDRCISRKKITDDNDWDVDPIRMFQFEDKVPILGLSNLMYLIIAGSMSRQCLPYVYRSDLIFHVGLSLSTELLQIPHDIPVWKGLQLADVLVSKMLPQSSIACAMLDLPIHRKFCTTLEKVVVFCNVEDCRRMGVQILQKYVLLMDLAARYQVFINLFPLLEHSGVKGVLVTSLKDTIRLSMSCEEALSYSASRLYRGRCLLKIIEVFCDIPNGPEVDLMEHSDHIIALLNLLWFLVLSDSTDVLGLWEHVPYLDRKFAHPLKEGLKLSRAHYELKVHQLEEERLNKMQEKSENKKRVEVTVTVQGEAVHDLSYEEKKQILNVALNKFSIMESLLTNIRERVDARFAARHSNH